MPACFRKYDPGKGRRDPDDHGDCEVRALHVATGLGYDAAWDALYALQGKYRTHGFNLPLYLDKGELGVIRRLSFPTERGRPRMTPAQFCRQYHKGSFILSLAHHVAAVEDGICYDSWDSTNKCVYVAWEISTNKR